MNKKLTKFKESSRHLSQNDLPPIDKFHPDWWYYRQEMDEPVEMDDAYKNESRNVNKKLIRLTEQDLHRIVKESVHKIINEIGDTEKGQDALGQIYGRAIRRAQNIGDKGAVPRKLRNTARNATHKAYSEADKNNLFAGIGSSFENGINTGYHKAETNESRINRVVKESVNRIVKENNQRARKMIREFDDYDNYDEFEEGDDFDWRIDDICMEFGDGEVLINGVLGLWDGKKRIQPTPCSDIRSAIWKCIGRDGEIMSPNDIEFDGETVLLKVSHHDGTNNFEITHYD